MQPGGGRATGGITPDTVTHCAMYAFMDLDFLVLLM